VIDERSKINMVHRFRWIFLVGLAAVIYGINYDFTDYSVSNGPITFHMPKIMAMDSRLFEEESTQIKYTKHDLACLAKNIYFEAGVENMVSKLAVAQVTLNRAKLGYWGTDICHVVYAKDQFSWTNDESRVNFTPKGENWNESLLAAKSALGNGLRIKRLKKALFYHADYVDPPWRDDNQLIGKFGRHIYYEKAKGSWLEL
jgi:spore germination cell wall hydrolase CwlJ-like protein